MAELYNKLVRDKIPDIIEADGKKPKTKVLDDEEFVRYLKDKLVEEAEELCLAFKDEDVKNEIVDIYEIFLSLLEYHKIDLEEIEKLRKEKAKKRGGFKKKIFLESVEE